LVKFDFETDLRFRDSLETLGGQASVDILEGLVAISTQHYQWDEFVQRFGWEPLRLAEIDTFPGGNDLHQFMISGPAAQQYQVVGYTHEHVIIVCAIARRGRNHLFPVDTTL
jgi:hypothetical protein